jgi:AsmA protein
LVILFLFRPGVGELRNRIAGSIGSALGRRVELDNVRLRLLPQPGFDLEGLVIYDDPAFSAEPMIRAQDVSAAIRFRSLLHGRLEIATLSATDPSINLVRNNAGRWNLTGLVERNAQIPAAPTAKPASERRPAFPYLEASGARINFKIGQTKKSYALVDGDVALWQDSENSWGARIKAAPVRTDFNLTDTGQLQINATWQRASSSRSTPLQIAVQWQKGQLGQITQLLTGKDRGWRGGVNFTANLSGTPEALRVEGNTTIDDFHRYDIAGSENVRLTTGCSGRYDWVTSSLDDLKCESPVGSGTVRLHGNFVVATQFPTYDVTLEVEKVPLASVVRLLRQAKKQIPSDLTANGLLNAEFSATRKAGEAVQRGSGGLNKSLPLPQWTGNGSATNVRLSSNAGKDEVVFGTIPLAVANSQATRLGQSVSLPVSLPASSRTNEKELEQPSELHVRVGPIPLSMNDSTSVNAGGWLSASGYRFFLRGDAELKELFHLENVLGLALAHPAAEGAAELDVSVSGSWQGFATASALGSAQLRNVRAEMRGLNTPIEISSANVTLTQDSVLLQKISAHTGSTHWSGSVTTPGHCETAALDANTASKAPNVGSSVGSNFAIFAAFLPSCTYQFDLTADELSTGDLAEWFVPHPEKRPWYRILNSNVPKGQSPLLAMEAQGNLRVGRFAFKKAVVTEVESHVEVQRGTITLGALRGQLLHGKYLGGWKIDALHRPVSYHGSGALQGISLPQVSALMNDPWMTGTADGNFELDGTSENFRDVLAHSDGKLQFVMRDGSLPHIQIPGTPGLLSVHRFTGDLELKKGIWELSAGRLESHNGIYQVKGTASASSGFNFVLTRGDERSWSVTGTLAKPQVAPVEQTEAKRMEAADAKTMKP